MELKGASAKKYLNCSWLSQILLLPLWGSLIVFWHDALSMCITGKDWAGIWREWPRSSLLLSPLGDLMTLFINFSNAARPFGVAVLSRISASLPTYSPMVIRFLKGHPYMNQGSFRRFLSFHQQDLNKGTHLCQNWALLEDLPNRQRIWTLQVQGKIELN